MHPIIVIIILKQKDSFQSKGAKKLANFFSCLAPRKICWLIDGQQTANRFFGELFITLLPIFVAFNSSLPSSVMAILDKLQFVITSLLFSASENYSSEVFVNMRVIMKKRPKNCDITPSRSNSLTFISIYHTSE